MLCETRQDGFGIAHKKQLYEKKLGKEPGKRIHSLDSMGHNWWGVCVGRRPL